MGVGKTSLMNRFMGMKFEENLPCTINADFRIKSLNIDPLTGAELTVWDTAGSEKFRSLTKQYFKDAHGVVLVFSVDKNDTFLGAQRWLKDIKDNCNENSSIILVGNKTDLENREVSSETASNFAMKNNLMYAETSSKEGMFVDVPFENLAIDIIKKTNLAKDNENVDIEQNLRMVAEKNAFEKRREKEVKCC